MGTTTALFNILASALSIWDSKEKTKYIDEKIRLEKRFYEEYNKDLAIRSDAVLDDVQLQLRILCNNVAAAIGAKNTGSK